MLLWCCLHSLLCLELLNKSTQFFEYRYFSPSTVTMMLLWLHLLSVCCCPSIMLLTHYIGIVLFLWQCCYDTFFTYGCPLLNPQVLLWCFSDAVPSVGSDSVPKDGCFPVTGVLLILYAGVFLSILLLWCCCSDSYFTRNWFTSVLGFTSVFGIAKKSIQC